MVKFWKFVNVLNWKIIAILGNCPTLQIRHFWNFINKKFQEFPKFEVLGIF